MVKVYSKAKGGKYSFDDFVEIVRILRSPGGCPWDIEQTHNSIRNSFVEEAYEAVDAIDRGDDKDLCEELGDVLLQIVLHSQMADEEKAFNIGDVIDGVCRKMILRHPHVFGEVKVDSTDTVLENWDNIKMQEKHQQSYTDTLKSVPMAFPALLRAAKVQKRASKVGFDWKDASGAFCKVTEELGELSRAAENNENDSIFEEYGDLLFSAVNVSRFLGIDPEQALHSATDKFIARFEGVETLAGSEGIDIKDCGSDKLDKLWREVKYSNG